MADYDLVVFGATGFTGALTAEYLARTAPEGCRWALAGRDPGKLAALRDRLAAIDGRCAALPLLTADSGDPASLREIAASAKVVATTVGPYLERGEALVAACAEEGTDYLDLTGEPEFVDRMYLAHHAKAAETGARIVHSCGFDSIPHDLGVWYTVRQLPEDVPLEVDGYVRVGARPSGGTLGTALTVLSRLPQSARAAKERAVQEPEIPGRSVRIPAGRPHRMPGTGHWALPLPTIDPQIVRHSARASRRYGPDFRYRHFAAFEHLSSAALSVAGAGALATAAQLPPARRALSRRLAPGDGPDEQQRARSWFRLRFLGRGGGEEVTTEVTGGDPGYDETAKMLAESALCLAFDQLPDTAGQLTTATAMGDALLRRLAHAGITFRPAVR
ncbi:saccharopine dehydrogenase family protein [Amycolatopsis panacis]|uniref:Saccharopine dehydrogenase n=1 Tax=Amycolatopsis panacis TaxID=2340917 RepID=A0A419I6B8_9PSEU|nr:saccharopine dehydrogenase NADP-binding domain-containing protein [Amycolatopsis panacis]RJQ86813.1 saccharopine dehydrogenase [Amycolatopsis panacis]